MPNARGAQIAEDKPHEIQLPVPTLQRQGTSLSQIDEVKAVDQSQDIEISVSMTKGAFESFVKEGLSDEASFILPQATFASIKFERKSQNFVASIDLIQPVFAFNQLERDYHSSFNSIILKDAVFERITLDKFYLTHVFQLETTHEPAFGVISLERMQQTNVTIVQLPLPAF